MTGAARERARPDVGQAVIYVYGVARLLSERGSAPLPPAGLVEGAAVERLVCGDLVAFVSVLPADLYGEDALQESFTDPDWLRERVIAHNAVLARLRTSSNILPFRFCTIYRDAAHVAKALAEHHGAFCEAFERVQDASEWAVKLYCDRAGSAAAGSKPAPMPSGSSAGRWTPRRRAPASSCRSNSTARSATQSPRISRPASSEAAQVLPMAPARSSRLNRQPAAVHGRTEEMVLHAACLVDEQALDRFRQIIATLQKESAGFVFEITGPWPPYHFVSTHQEGFNGAARQ